MKAKKKKKVFFIFNATTHYYNLVLNKLNSFTDYEIHIIVPKERKNNVGAAVFQTTENLKIQLHELEERVKYKIIGSYFPDLPALIWKERPKIIVTLTAYERGLYLHPLTFFLLKLFDIKIVLKNIPFRFPAYKNPFQKLREQLEKRKLSFADLRRYKRQIINDFLEKWFYAYVHDAHVCYVERAYELYPTYGVNPKSIFITYNSPDTDFLLETNEKAKQLAPVLPYNPYRLIHIGRLVDWKRVDLIIRAVNILKEKFPEVELLVAGFGPQEEEWQKLAVALGVQDRVIFLGGVYDYLRLGQYLHSSSIYVLGGMGGLSINDAMCFEKPIVCSICDGTEVKLVKDGINGFYFKEGDFNDLAAKIEKIFVDPDLAKRMGQNSVSIIKNEINIQKVLEGYTKAFEYALNK